MAPAIISRASIPLGLIFSTTGSYRTVGQEMLDGALLALEEINDSSEFDFNLAPSFRDPAGDLTNYRVMCEDLLRDRSICHIVGCYTSSSRKEVIPAIEKYDALLWYPSHYEGFETCSSVVYTGASPNQHIVPLSEYMLGQFGLRVYCVGSNYIWAWENNRILREIVGACGGTVVAEKYHPVGSVELGHFIEDIKTTRPDFIFNTLIGESAYAFYRAYYESNLRRASVDSKYIPIASCSLSEPELWSIGGEAAAGHIASSVYFQTIDRPRNHDFVTRFRKRFGPNKVTSADAEASYIAVILLAHAKLRLASHPIAVGWRGREGHAMTTDYLSLARKEPQATAAALVALIGLATIGGFFFFQYGLGYPPCPLCLEQRNAFYVAVPLAALLWLGGGHGASRKVLVAGFAVIAAVMLWNSGLAAYHAGVEWKFWPGPQDCSGPIDNFGSTKTLLKQLGNISIVRCDQAAWRFLGLSLAGWDVLVSLMLAGIAAWGAKAAFARREN